MPDPEHTSDGGTRREACVAQIRPIVRYADQALRAARDGRLAHVRPALDAVEIYTIVARATLYPKQRRAGPVADALRRLCRAWRAYYAAVDAGGDARREGDDVMRAEDAAKDLIFSDHGALANLTALIMLGESGHAASYMKRRLTRAERCLGS